ncbi:MAG: hypothetical protein KGP35_07605 [Bacteroidetes bacterium]|nr:hypothetical protein [Bacteroidota bacterium]
MSSQQLPKHFWSGFWIMILAYTLVRLFFYEPVVAMPQWVPSNRQLLRWINITFVYVVGIWVIRRMGIGWMLLLWNLVHIALLAYLLLAAVYEWGIAPLPYGIRGSVAPIIEFLISPVYYIGLGVLYLYLNRFKKTDHQQP